MKKNKSQKLPDLRDIDKMLSDIADHSDREMAIVGVNLLEFAARICLVAHFVDLTSNEEKHVLEGRGPLSTFSAKIEILYAIGAISKRVKKEIDLVRKIRNVFAHDLYVNQIPATECREFEIIDDHIRYLGEEIGDNGTFLPNEQPNDDILFGDEIGFVLVRAQLDLREKDYPRSRYMYSIRILFFILFAKSVLKDNKIISRFARTDGQ